MPQTVLVSLAAALVSCFVAILTTAIHLSLELLKENSTNHKWLKFSNKNPNKTLINILHQFCVDYMHLAMNTVQFCLVVHKTLHSNQPIFAPYLSLMPENIALDQWII